MGKDMRIGHGYDVHRLAEGRKLIIGGVKIDHEKGLLGHSDADVLTHAVMDAVLGAAGLDNIGVLFPDTAEKYLGISSLVLAEEVGRLVKERGFEIGNVDATVIAQRPKLSPYLAQMQERVAAALGCPAECVRIKATTEEKMGFTGDGTGIAAHAVCIVARHGF
jgi:2-C-methyl-D-erythritol 2,4-cyclodiphosphate synthase